MLAATYSLKDTAGSSPSIWCTRVALIATDESGRIARGMLMAKRVLEFEAVMVPAPLLL